MIDKERIREVARRQKAKTAEVADRKQAKAENKENWHRVFDGKINELWDQLEASVRETEETYNQEMGEQHLCAECHPGQIVMRSVKTGAGFGFDLDRQRRYFSGWLKLGKHSAYRNATSSLPVDVIVIEDSMRLMYSGTEIREDELVALLLAKL